MVSPISVLRGAVLVVVVAMSRMGAGIKCYDCTSANNSACLDMNFHGKPSLIPLVDCERTFAKQLVKQPASNFFCRKMEQIILNPGRDPEVRITRGCGWVKSKKSCYNADNDDHLETVCQCFLDRCNSSPARHPHPATLAAAIVATLLTLLSTAAVI